MKNTLRISYSSTNTWKRCSWLHWMQYVLGCKSQDEGASLKFGTAIDYAIVYLLSAKRDNKEIPTIEQVQDIFLNDEEKGWQKAYDDSTLRYTKYDLDPKVFTPSDWELVSHWEKELKSTIEETRKAFNQKSFKRMSPEDDHLYSRLAWLSLKEKGNLMLEAFYKEILPQIEEVISVQHKFTGMIGDCELVGYLDLVARIKDKAYPVVIDIKTSAMQYEFDSVILSEQLRFYLAYCGKDLGTHLAGYCVMLKSMTSDTFCSVCGNQKTSSHKTCNAIVGGKRCDSQWLEKPKASTQLIIDEIPEQKIEETLKDLGQLVSIMESGLKYHSFQSCKDFGLCPMYYACVKGDLDSVVWRSEGDKQKFLKGE